MLRDELLPTEDYVDLADRKRLFAFDGNETLTVRGHICQPYERKIEQQARLSGDKWLKKAATKGRSSETSGRISTCPPSRRKAYSQQCLQLWEPVASYPSPH